MDQVATTMTAPTPMPRIPRAATALLALAFVGCDDGAATAPDVLTVEVDPVRTLLVGPGDTVTFEARALGEDGEPLPFASVGWISLDPGVVEVSSTGRATAVGGGETTLVASSGDVVAFASVEVWVPTEVAAFVPGQRYFGREGYVEYVPGTLPVVISVPHGGDLEPEELPDRTYGTLVLDRNTRATAWAIRAALRARTGMAPHLVFSHLRRTKLDPNREIVEGAQEDPFTEQAWSEFQTFVEIAADRVEAAFGVGLYLDLHGHAHPIPRVEIGLLLDSDDLARPDAELDALAESSSLRALAARAEIPFSELVRGRTSLGTLLEGLGYPSVPSMDAPDPGEDPYFSGGYNTARHGSRDGGTVDGMQLELPFPDVRESGPAREAFAEALAEALEQVLREHYGLFPAP